jgi:hypothetical protein
MGGGTGGTNLGAGNSILVGIRRLCRGRTGQSRSGLSGEGRTDCEGRGHPDVARGARTLQFVYPGGAGTGVPVVLMHGLQMTRLGE